MATSIGTLTAFITADGAKFMSEFNKLDKQIARSSSAWTKTGSKFALGFIGMESAVKGVVSQIREVVDNIENIKGVDPQAQASIIEMNKNLAEAKTTLQGFAASAVGLFAKAGQSIGVYAAGVVNNFQGIKTDTSTLSVAPTPNEIAASKDPNFTDKLRAAEQRLSEAKKATAMASMDEVAQIVALRREADAYDRAAAGNSKNDLERIELRTRAEEKQAQAASKMQTMREQLIEAEKQSAETMKDVILASSIVPTEEKLKALQAQANTIRFAISAMQGADQNDPAVLKAQLDARKQLEELSKRMIPLLDKEKQLYVEVGSTISSAFEEAVFSATKLSDAIRGLANDILRMMFRQTITGPLTNFLSGSLQSLFIPGGSTGAGVAAPVPGRAVGGPVFDGKPYMVGENGPELFIPSGSGRINPNSGGGNVYQIDARGTDESVVQRLQQALFALAGPGVVERRALSANVSAMRRGGGMGRALQGA